jgi:hypothetical protein
MDEGRHSERDGQAAGISAPLIALFRGVLYRDQNPGLWQQLLAQTAQVRDAVRVFGLDLILDEAEGHAYLRQRSAQEGEPELPRLVPRRQLSYPVSLLLALLRKKLAEHDVTGGDARLVLSREQIADLVRLFTPDSSNEAKLVDRIDADINRIVDLGFLRRLRDQGDQYEVRRILKAFIDAQWLAGLEERLAEYRAHTLASHD